MTVASAGTASSSMPAVVGALLVLAAALCASAADGDVDAYATGNTTVPAMYVFGDSLVDAGNNDFLPPPVPRALPPNGVDLPRSVLHHTGRFTNGFNLADIIAQHVGFKMSPPAYLSLTPLSSLDLLRGRVGANYASGGSGILDATFIGTISLRQQVELFRKTKARILRAGLVGRERLDELLGRSLFVISTGGNDFSAFDDGGLPMNDAPAFIAGMVADYIKYINELYELGARKLVLLDILPVGCLPSQRAITATGDCDADGNTLSQMFNAVLRTEMAGAVSADSAMPGLRYSICGLYNVLSDMIADPARAGLREVEVACCGGGRFNGEVQCSSVGGGSLCADRDAYLFWDEVHGTQAAYLRAVRAFFYGSERDAEPINLAQLVGAPSTTAPPATAAYSSI